MARIFLLAFSLVSTTGCLDTVSSVDAGADAVAEVTLDATTDGISDVYGEVTPDATTELGALDATAELGALDALDGDQGSGPDLGTGPDSLDFGNSATSCGSPSQNLTPVDCTVNGDTQAYCVFSNHCGCSDGFECETPFGPGAGNECAAGSVCVVAQWPNKYVTPIHPKRPPRPPAARQSEHQAPRTPSGWLRASLV